MASQTTPVAAAHVAAASHALAAQMQALQLGGAAGALAAPGSWGDFAAAAPAAAAPAAAGVAALAAAAANPDPAVAATAAAAALAAAVGGAGAGGPAAAADPAAAAEDLADAGAGAGAAAATAAAAADDAPDALPAGEEPLPEEQTSRFRAQALLANADTFDMRGPAPYTSALPMMETWEDARARAAIPPERLAAIRAIRKGAWVPGPSGVQRRTLLAMLHP